MNEHQNRPEQFNARLRDGQYSELRVALHFMLKGCLTRLAFVGGRYDIEVRTPDGVTAHVEVKWDRRGGRSGNLLFEVENTRQRTPSGITSTTADWWCHVIGEGPTEAASVVWRRAPRCILNSEYSEV